MHLFVCALLLRAAALRMRMRIESKRIEASRESSRESSRVGSRVGQKGDTILVAMTFTAMFKLWRGMLSLSFLLLLLLEHRKKQRSTAYKKRYGVGGNK